MAQGISVSPEVAKRVLAFCIILPAVALGARLLTDPGHRAHSSHQVPVPLPPHVPPPLPDLGAEQHQPAESSWFVELLRIFMCVVLFLPLWFLVIHFCKLRRRRRKVDTFGQPLLVNSGIKTLNMCNLRNYAHAYLVSHFVWVIFNSSISHCCKLTRLAGKLVSAMVTSPVTMLLLHSLLSLIVWWASCLWTLLLQILSLRFRWLFLLNT